MKSLTKDISKDISEMMEEAKDKGYSVREIPWCSETTLLCLSKNLLTGEIQAFNIFPDKFNDYLLTPMPKLASEQYRVAIFSSPFRLPVLVQ